MGEKPESSRIILHRGYERQKEEIESNLIDGFKITYESYTDQERDVIPEDGDCINTTISMMVAWNEINKSIINEYYIHKLSRFRSCKVLGAQVWFPNFELLESLPLIDGYCRQLYNSQYDEIITITVSKTKIDLQ